MEVSADPVYRTEVLTDCLADEPADSPPTRLRVYAWRARAPGLAASFATNRKGPHGEAITLEAPPLEEFQKAFRHLRAGQSLRHGVDGVGGRKRARKLSWSLAEALRESDTKIVIDRAH